MKHNLSIKLLKCFALPCEKQRRRLCDYVTRLVFRELTAWCGGNCTSIPLNTEREFLSKDPFSRLLRLDYRPRRRIKTEQTIIDTQCVAKSATNVTLIYSRIIKLTSTPGTKQIPDKRRRPLQLLKLNIHMLHVGKAPPCNAHYVTIVTKLIFSSRCSTFSELEQYSAAIGLKMEALRGTGILRITISAHRKLVFCFLAKGTAGCY